MSEFDRNSLSFTLRKLSRWTNRLIGNGLNSGLGVLEETITDYVLNDIAVRHPEFIYTKKFSRKQEGNVSGADWLWCIGGPGAWLPILVQAKIVNPITGQCHHLDYSTQRGYQRGILLRYARYHKFLPLYCIYSLIEDSTVLESAKISQLSSLSRTDWACSFVIPKYVKRLVSQHLKSQQDLLRYGIPWAFPFSKNIAGQKLAQDAAKSFFKMYCEFERRDRVAIKTKQSVSQSASPTTVASYEKESRIQWASVDPQLLITPNVPRLVIQLLGSRVRHDIAPVSAVSIISNQPVANILKELGVSANPHKRLLPYKYRKQRKIDRWEPWRLVE